MYVYICIYIYIYCMMRAVPLACSSCLCRGVARSDSGVLATRAINGFSLCNLSELAERSHTY